MTAFIIDAGDYTRKFCNRERGKFRHFIQLGIFIDVNICGKFNSEDFTFMVERIVVTFSLK